MSGKNAVFPDLISLAEITSAEGFHFRQEQDGDFVRSPRSFLTASDAGDFNGDGRDDIIIGIPNSSRNGTNSGGVYIVLGNVVLGIPLNIRPVNVLNTISLVLMMLLLLVLTAFMNRRGVS